MDNFKDTKNSRTMRRINGFYQEKSLNLMISIWTLGLLATQVSRALGAGAPWVGHRFSQVTEPDGESLEEATGLPERPASQPPEPGHGMQQKSSRVPGPSLKDNGGDYTKPEVTVGLSENLRGYLRVQGGFAKDPLHSAPKR